MREERFEMVRMYPDVDAYWVRDNDASQYHMPEKAVTFNLRGEAASYIAHKLNEEWRYFLTHGD